MGKETHSHRLHRADKPYKYVLKKLSIGLVSVTVGATLIAPVGTILAQETDSSSLLNQVEEEENHANDSIENEATDGEAVQAVQTVQATERSQSVVRIHYTPNQGDSRKFYAWVWGDTAAHSQDGRWEELTHTGQDYQLTIQVDAGVKQFNYIIAAGSELQGDKSNWDSLKNSEKIFGGDNLIAPATLQTDTDIYHSADWYSQFLNVQTKEFDQKYAYKDKEAGGEVVGKKGALGGTLLADGSGQFNVWAPTATSVSLNIYESNAEDAPLKKTITMTRGTDENAADHTQNTIGLWSATVSAGDLDGMDLNGVAYDYTIVAPNAYFIQKTVALAKQQGDGSWKPVAYNYTNTATGATLNSTISHNEVQSQPSKKEIAEFYVGEDCQVVTQDPYSVATVRNGKRSVLIDPSKVGTAVTVTNNKRVSSTSQMSVLETNVRDFSIAENSGIHAVDKGNYLGFVQEGTTNPNTGQKTGLDYLKYLGVNYLQMMPLNDFETVPELDKDSAENNVISEPEPDGVHNNQQNWGYDPKNYNVPEGSYATDPANPTNRIEELKTMMQKLHDAGINVNLDVVYNHLYDGQKNPFEYTVPGYYYAVNSDGAMNNDIGVGNAVRSNSEMMRQYIVSSVVYWAKEYGMDGFRFDAMSDLDTTTLTAVRQALDAIDPNIVTYGEGWDSMGNYLAKDGDVKASIGNATQIPHYGFFDSTGRDAIAGSAYGDHPNHPGFINRTDSPYGISNHFNNAGQVADSLLGGHGRSYASASQQLNYIEVHDGMTLNDLLKAYNPNDTAEEHVNRVKLASAMSALSQGIHFSQHGQEFLRTKNGSHNTYNGGDKLNQINWALTTEHVDVVNFAKSILTLRQSDSSFQMSDYQEILSKMIITNAQDQSGVITYELTRGNGAKYLVIFNNNPLGDKKLILGGDNYYYGTEKRGQINEQNDFSKTFIVTSSAQGLYGKIGHYNDEKTISLDPLSATVLYLSAAPTLTTETVDYEQDISKKVTVAKIKSDNPQEMFGYENSGIQTNSEKDLGHAKNVLTSLKEAEKEAVYYATDANGNLITTDHVPAVEMDGKPVDTPEVKWVLKGSETTPANKLTPIPSVKANQTIKTKFKQAPSKEDYQNGLELPDGAQVTDIVEAADVSTSGKKASKVRVTFADGSSRVVDVTVDVEKETTPANKLTPIPSVKANQTIKTKFNQAPSKEDYQNGLELPDGAQVTDIVEAADVSTSGKKASKVRVTFADGSSRVVDVTVDVEKETTPANKLTPIPSVKANQTIKTKFKQAPSKEDYQNGLELPDGAQVTDIVEAADVSTSGKKASKVRVTFADGSSRVVDVTVDVEKETTPANKLTPIPSVKANQTIKTKFNQAPSKEDYQNGLELPDGARVTDIVEAADVSTSGKKASKVRVTFADGSSRVVDVTVDVEKEKTPTPDKKDSIQSVYRLYHPGLQVHLYTADTNERNILKNRGWNYEGEAWKTRTNEGEAVYRLYHPELRVHLYTKDANEYKVLATRGWNQEGIAYRSSGKIKVYRLYHSGIKKHHYTRDENEYSTLAKRGWIQEGIAWYSEK